MHAPARFAVVLLVACAAAGAAPAPAQATAPPPPRVGSCYTYTFAQAQVLSLAAAPVPCRGNHTAVTYFVGRLTGPAAAGPVITALAVRSAANVCTVRQLSVLGPRVLLTRSDPFNAFMPTNAQWTAGARWFRCDAVLYASDTSLQRIPANFVRRIRTTSGVNAYRACLTAAGKKVPCSRPHTYAASTYSSLGSRTAAYPGDRTVKARAIAACRRLLPRNGRRIYVEWPTAHAWSIGRRYVQCFAAV